MEALLRPFELLGRRTLAMLAALGISPWTGRPSYSARQSDSALPCR